MCKNNKEENKMRELKFKIEGMMCEGGCMGGVDSQISNLILSKNHAKAENEKVKDVKIVENCNKYQNISCHFDKETDR